MAVVDTDIIVFGSANMQEDDTSTPQGGAMDTTTLIVFTELTQTTAITAVSDNAGDTQNLTITGRLANGSIDSEILTMTGVTPVVGSTSFERILKMVFATATTGQITIDETTGGADIIIIPAALSIDAVRRPFYNASAEASGGSQVDLYEKIFFENSNAVSALTNATIEEIADVGGAGSVEFYLDATLDASDSSTNRVTEPAAATGNWSSATLNVANSQVHTEETAQGVWLHLVLPAGAAANNSSYQLRESGQTV